MDYSPEVARRFGSPRGAAAPPVCRDQTVIGEAEDRTLNIWVRFYLDLEASSVASARFEVFGCPHSIAAASWVAEWLVGRDIDEVAALDMHTVADALQLPATKLGKLLRIEDALRQGLARRETQSPKRARQGE